MMQNAHVNRLIAALPRTNQRQFVARCEKVYFIFDEVLYEPGEPIRYVYFAIDGYISVISHIDYKSSLEVALVGSEGMIGISSP
jgi:CRP-like cAMP-binding protein